MTTRGLNGETVTPIIEVVCIPSVRANEVTKKGADSTQDNLRVQPQQKGVNQGAQAFSGIFAPTFID